MKRSFLINALALVMIIQPAAQADLIDLPDPGDAGGGSSSPSAPQPGPQDSSAQYAGSVRVNGVSRRTGGTLYTVKLQKALKLIRLDFRVMTSKAKIYEMTAVTESGQRLDIRQMRQSDVLAEGSLINSESLSAYDKIISVDFLVESFSVEADVMLTALAVGEVPKLSLVPSAQPLPQPQPTPEPAPAPAPTPTPQEPGQPDLGGIADFRAKDRVLYNSESVGTVVAVYGSDTIEVVFDDGTRTTVEAFFLEKSVRCYENFCENGKVQYNGTNARVVNAFPSGWILIATQSGSRQLVDAFFLSEGLQCDNRNRFCVGDAILYQNQYDGKIIGLRDNGAYELSLAGSQQVYTASAAQLASSLRCTSGEAPLCAGDRVLMSGRWVSVIAVYSNGRARVQGDGGNLRYMVSLNELAKPVRCYAGVCVGQKVFYGKDRATVKEVYSNGTARIALGLLSFGKEYIVSVRTLQL